MSTEKMRASFRLLMLIATPKLTDKALLLFEKGKLPMQLQAYAHGTASREMMDMLGLDSGEKSLLLTMMPKTDADDLLIRLRRELRLGLSGSGIAFTVPISGANKRVLQMVQQVCQEKPKPEMRRALMQENDYQIIVALVNQGYSEEVMAAARPAGRGGRNGAAQPPCRRGRSAQPVGIQLAGRERSRDDSRQSGKQAGDYAGDLRQLRPAKRSAGHCALPAGG